MEAAQMLQASTRDAPGLCSKTSNTASSRPCRARNPWAPNLATELAAACGDDVPARCKSPPRNSLRRTPTGQHRPAARTKVLPPTSKATPPPSESVFVLGCSRELDTTPIIPQLDARCAHKVAELCEPPDRSHLDLPAPASQTNFMAHTYLLFDFGTDEEKAQLARHKLEGWKQAFRLDKKLQYKLERGEDEAKPASEPVQKAAEPAKAEKSKPKTKSKAKPAKAEASEEAPPANGKVNLLVRLYFSGHEKLTEQRWLDRIPSEEPFKEASPRMVRQGEEQFDEVVKQFDSLG
jgi:hypothetical protein